MKLVTANIKREDAQCTTVEQYFGKATSTGPDVKTGAACWIKLGKGVKPADQFQRAPRLTQGKSLPSAPTWHLQCKQRDDFFRGFSRKQNRR